MNSFRREWGAFFFVATVLVGALAVAVSFAIGGTGAKASFTPLPCPTFTPFSATPTPAAGTPSGSATAQQTPTATPFSIAFLNCPTPSFVHTATVRPVPSASIPAAPTATPVPTPAGTPFNVPTPVGN